MDFPIYRKLIAPAGIRGQFPTNQYFMFLSERKSLNVRLDNVFSIGLAEDMPASIAADMIERWDQSAEAEFWQAYNEAKRVIGMVAEMVP